MVIKRVFKDGSSDEQEFKSVEAFRKSSKSRDKNLISAMIIDAVTKIIIAFITLKSQKILP